MKKLLSTLALTTFIASSAFAYLPSSAVTTMSLQVYGIYTSADPTCTTGMIATIPLTLTPQTINFAASAAIGSGTLPATIGCVVIVVKDSLSNAWAAGTYDALTSNGHSDASCDAGGSNTGQTICNNGVPTWPDQVKTDAAAIGLAIRTADCSGATATAIVPLVLSTNSLCTGQAVADAATPACNGGNINNFAMPTSAADVVHGTKLTAPSTAGNLKFIVNPTNTLGDQGSGCGNQAAPLFSFAAS